MSVEEVFVREVDAEVQVAEVRERLQGIREGGLRASRSTKSLAAAERSPTHSKVRFVSIYVGDRRVDGAAGAVLEAPPRVLESFSAADVEIDEHGEAAGDQMEHAGVDTRHGGQSEGGQMVVSCGE